ncbi:histidine kinase [Corallococcus exiguus]|uniref:Sensor histidine kinase n=1 Tax=Corallococcus exiguus TaxID=83462 RepID=A0A7X4Y9L3_9BACT|nr:ATP-binding protein [Corallococcus exiguus]NBC40182.1 sensor histidine kinase [Corallococcus exiguus]TNV63503.1 HAMP domain-containing histidine kinase [Corallococcus exiguus]
MSAALDVKGSPGDAGASFGGQGLESVDLPDVFQVDVAVCVRDALGLLGATRRLRGMEVALELPEDPVIARVSRRRLEQVLLLLVAHAADVAPQAAPSVRVVVDPPDDFGDVGPRFQVVMPGVSLSERETRSVVLSPLRVGSTQRRLARARELVDAMGGEFAVERLEEGTAVSVVLPAPGLASF